MVKLNKVEDYFIDKEELFYKLGEAVFFGYSGANFSTSGVLDDKKETLRKIKQILKTTPNLDFYKNNQEYWYPIKNMDVNFYENHPRCHFYIVNDRKNSLSNFKATKPEKDDEFRFHFSMIDPLKMIFNLMIKDVRTNNCEADVTKEVLQVNNEIFMLVKDIVGDVRDYAGRNLYEYCVNYLKEIERNHNEALEHDFSQDYLDSLKRKHEYFKEDLVNIDFMLAQAKMLSLDEKINVTEKKQQIKM